MVNIGTLLATLKLRDQMTPALARASNSLKMTGAKLTKIGGQMQSTGTALTMGLTLPIVALGAAAAMTFGGFEKAMNRVRAVSGATGKDFDALKEQAKDLGSTTKFTAVEAADAMGFLGMAGFKTNEIMGAMPNVLQLAASATLDIGQAADITSNILTGYNQTTDDLAHTNNVLVKSFTSANTDLVQLGEAFKYAGPVASAAGVSFESTAAALSLLGNAGIQGSMAGTSLRGALTRLMNPSGKAAKLIRALGINAQTSTGDMKNFDEIIREVAESGATSAQMMEIFGQRAGPAMMALVSQGADALSEMTEELTNVGNIAQEIADIQMEGLAGSWTLFTSALSGALIEIGEVLAPMLQKFLEIGVRLSTWVKEELVPGFKNLSPTLQTIILGFVGFLAALGPVLAIGGTLIISLGMLALSFASLTQGVTTLTMAYGRYAITSKAATAATWLATLAQRALNFAMKVNPIFAVTALIYGLTLAVLANWDALTKWITKIRESGRLWELLVSSLQGHVQLFHKLRDVTKDVTKELQNQIPQLRIADFQFDQLGTTVQIMTGDFEKLTSATYTLTEAQKEFNTHVAAQVTEWRQGGIPAMEVAMAAYQEFGGITKMTRSDLEELNQVLQTGVQRLHAQGKAIPLDQFEAWIHTTKALLPPFNALNAIVEEFGEEQLPILGRALGTLAGWTLRVPKAVTSTVGLFGQLKEGIGKHIGGLNDIFIAAFEGGGGVAGAIRSFTTGALRDLLNQIPLVGEDLSKFAGTFVAVAEKIWDAVGSGVSEAEHAGRSLVKTFEDTVRASLSVSQRAEAGGVLWREVVVGVRDAYLSAGRSAQAAEDAVKQLWDASRQGPEAVQGIIDSMQHVITLGQQVEAMENDWRGAEEAAQRYGMSLDKLGKGHKAAKWAEEVEQLTTDWQLLNIQGAKADHIAKKMSPTVQAMIDKYRSAGIQIPDALRPVIEHQVKMGLLLDEDGEKMKDLSTISFAEPLVKQFDRLIGSIQTLVDTLTGRGGVTDSLQQVNQVDLRDKSFTVTRHFENRGVWNPREAPLGFQQGTGGRFVDFGQGTPAILHGKERIQTLNDAKSEGAGLAGLERRLGSIEQLLRDQPREMSVAISDSLTLLN